MGWTVLYIAFGVVALWLLGEVLLQYKARLRWRLLAFSGFLCVVLGVLIPSVLVIALGAVAFAVGQTYVTLSFRRGFSTGWAIGGSPGASRRRRGERPAVKEEPVLEVSGLEYEEPAAPAQDDGPADVYEPQPMPEETGQYGVYSPSPYAQPAGDQGYQEQQPVGAQPQYASHDPYNGYGESAQNPSYDGGYSYGTDQHSYAAYSDPYIGTGGTAAPSYASYDAYGNAGGNGYGNGYDAGAGGYDGYADPQPYAEPYAAPQYGADTPPGGVWVPQQREGEQYPQGTPAPYGNGYPAAGDGHGNGNGNDTGPNEQYRY
ncbi:hypothetical protein [Streptomyces sp. NBC_00102]|uniref:hypothetical protein n=1 Tax=Streptomyces sp. NBC_00102 TaxID=2975652 RepID=UPI002259AAA6|nr:hypothetical protein [Streptomyces sp. NBC_00102]MCX5396513.1 hypothetical protein [Streptomyces sp. NBC_00102]